MSIKTHELAPRYKGSIEYLRRQQDGFWDFMHADSPRRMGIFLELERSLFEDFPELLEKIGRVERIQFVIRRAPSNIREAFFYLCVTLMPSLRDALCHPDYLPHPNRDRLGFFLLKVLRPMVREFMEGRGGFYSPDAFVRSVRPQYVCFVGWNEDPVAAEKTQTQQMIRDR